MTTTSQQPPAGDAAGGGATRTRRGRTLGAVAALVVAVVAVAALVWLFAAGPLSASARTQREVERVLHDLGASESLAEFNGHLCAEQRMPQEMLDQIAGSGAQTGVDLDSMFREQILGSFPDELTVTSVEVDGDDAVATVESSGGEGTPGPEELRLRREDGAWTVCEPGVGMGAMPSGRQPG